MSFVKEPYLVIVEKEAEEVGEAQHGVSVHAIVQVILQELLLQDHVVPKYVFLLCVTHKEKSASGRHSAPLCHSQAAKRSVPCPCARHQGTEV